MSVVSNLMVRVKADFSGLYGEFKAANSRVRAEARKTASAALAGGGIAEQLKKTQTEILQTEKYLAGVNAQFDNMHYGITQMDVDVFAALEKESDKLAAKLSQLRGQEALLKIREDADGAKQEVRQLGNAAEDAGQKTSEPMREGAKHTSLLGKAARGAASGLGKMASWMGRTAASVLHLGHNSRAALPGIEKMLRGLQRIGGVAVGMRLVSAVTGRLRSVVNGYIQDNAALKAQTDALKDSLGQALAPAINLVTNALSAGMPYVLAFSNAIGSLLSKVFGKGWTTISKDANAAASAIGGASAAQKEFNRQLAGFDEITKLDSQSSSGGGGGGSSSGGIVTEDISGSIGWLTDIQASIAAAIDGSGTWLQVGQTIGNKVRGGLEAIDWRLVWLSGKAKILAAGDTFRGIFAGLLDTSPDWHSIAKTLGRKIREGVSTIKWSTVWGGCKGILRTGVDRFRDFTAGLFGVENAEGWEPIAHAAGQQIAGAINGIEWDALWEDTKASLNTGISSMRSFMAGLLDQDEDANWSQIGRAAGEKIVAALGNIPWGDLYDMGVGIIKIPFEFLGGLADGAWGDWWKVNIQEPFESWAANHPLVLNITANLGAVWTEIQNGMSDFGDYLSAALNGNGTSWVENYREEHGVTGMAPWEREQKNLNLIDSFFGLFGHATGGIFTGPTLFGNHLFGENGTEALLPLQNNLEYLDPLADRIASKIGSGQPTVVYVTIDGKVVGKASVDYINNTAAETGLNPIAGAL